MQENQFYWVRPYVPGVSLQTAPVLSRSLEQTLAISRCILAALKELHNHGLLGLSLKPTNLIITDEVSPTVPS